MLLGAIAPPRRTYTIHRNEDGRDRRSSTTLRRAFLAKARQRSWATHRRRRRSTSLQSAEIPVRVLPRARGATNLESIVTSTGTRTGCVCEVINGSYAIFLLEASGRFCSRSSMELFWKRFLGMGGIGGDYRNSHINFVPHEKERTTHALTSHALSVPSSIVLAQPLPRWHQGPSRRHQGPSSCRHAQMPVVAQLASLGLTQHTSLRVHGQRASNAWLSSA